VSSGPSFSGLAVPAPRPGAPPRAGRPRDVAVTRACVDTCSGRLGFLFDWLEQYNFMLYVLAVVA
jgi:hypothetical protein